MNFSEALAAMMKGKTIKRKGYAECISLNDVDDIELSDCLHVEWEIYQEPKWEPEGGDWVIFPHRVGNVVEDCRSIPEQFKNYGIQRPTKEQAEAARDKMRTFNRLLAYVDEYSDEGEICDTYIYKNTAMEQWRHLSTIDTYADRVLMPARVAIQLCNDLNSGRVIL